MTLLQKLFHIQYLLKLEAIVLQVLTRDFAKEVMQMMRQKLVTLLKPKRQKQESPLKLIILLIQVMLKLETNQTQEQEQSHATTMEKINTKQKLEARVLLELIHLQSHQLQSDPMLMLQQDRLLQKTFQIMRLVLADQNKPIKKIGLRKRINRVRNHCSCF